MPSPPSVDAESSNVATLSFTLPRTVAPSSLSSALVASTPETSSPSGLGSGAAASSTPTLSLMPLASVVSVPSEIQHVSAEIASPEESVAARLPGPTFGARVSRATATYSTWPALYVVEIPETAFAQVMSLASLR